MEAVTAQEAATERPRTLDARSLCDAFQMTVADNLGSTAIRTKGDEVSYTWRDYADHVRGVAGGLAALGVGRGDTVGIMLTNRPEFHFADTGAIHLGAIPFSIYNTYTADQIRYLLQDAGCTVLVTEQAFLDRVLDAKADTKLEHVVVVDPSGDEPEGVMTLEQLEGAGSDDFDFEAAWRAVEPGDIVTIIYTSGTTGPPKGVQITHGNILASVREFYKVIPFPLGGRVVSWLPMAHIAERQCSQYLPMILAFTVTCCPDPKQVVFYLPEVRPTWFFAVPRLWEKLKAALEAGLAAEQDEQKKQATRWALDVGLRRVRLIQQGEPVPPELEEEYQRADELVLSKIRERIGLDQAHSVNVGAAPSTPEVIEFYHAIGIPLAELWGMSETCGAGTCNPPDKVKIGTVGPPPPGIEIRIADDGEVLLRGPVVMAGYRNLPDKTREAIDEDGWLHTGDVGKLDEDGYLTIVDRKKEIIINAAGKNMSPANIEAVVKASSPLIGQAIAIGDRRPYNVALITLDPDVAPAFAAQHGIEDASLASLSRHPKVIAAVQEGIDKANEQLARVEQIKKFKILPTDWEPGGDELTPTMKLKRKPIAEKYAAEIEALYAEG